MAETAFVSDLYRSYEHDVAAFIRNFTQRDSRFITMSLNEKESFLNYAEKNYAQTERSYHQLNSELRGLPINIKSKLEPSVKGYKQNLNKIMDRLRSIRGEVAQSKLAAEQEKNKDTSKSAMNRIGNTMMSANRRLQDIKRLAVESSEMTIGINQTLAEDRVRLLDVKSTNKMIEGNLNRGLTLISSIRYKDTHNRVMLYGIVLLLGLLNFLVFVLKVFT